MLFPEFVQCNAWTCWTYISYGPGRYSVINTKFVIFIYYRENAVLAILLRKCRLCPNALDWSEH